MIRWSRTSAADRYLAELLVPAGAVDRARSVLADVGGLVVDPSEVAASSPSSAVGSGRRSRRR